MVTRKKRCLAYANVFKTNNLHSVLDQTITTLKKKDTPMTTTPKRFVRHGFPRLINDDEHVIMCEGIDQLLRRVQQHGSIYAAAKEMGMAYSKAWRLIKEASKSMGFDYLVTDGPHGSQVTAQAIAIMQEYERVRDNIPSFVTVDIPRS